MAFKYRNELFLFVFLGVFSHAEKTSPKIQNPEKTLTKTENKDQSDFANCSLANKQLKQLNEFVPSELRVQAAQILMQDLDLLRPQLEKNTTGLPNKLLRLCYDIKRQAFESVFTKGAADLYGYFDFLMTSGRFFFYEKAWEAAYQVFEAASKMQPRLLVPNHYALQSWMMFQLTTEKPVSTEVYMQTSRRYISAMMSAQDVTEVQKKSINQYLGIIEEKSNKIYTARKMNENAVALDPNNLKLRLSWGEFEERSGRFEEASKIYSDAIALKVDDKETKKKIFMRSLSLLKRVGAKDKLNKQVKEALAAFPNENEFNTFKEKIISSKELKRAPASAQ